MVFIQKSFNCGAITPSASLLHDLEYASLVYRFWEESKDPGNRVSLIDRAVTIPINDSLFSSLHLYENLIWRVGGNL